MDQPNSMVPRPLGAIIGILTLGLVLGACTAPPAEIAADRYCYRTLARVDCHAEPLPGEASRQVGYFDWAAL